MKILIVSIEAILFHLKEEIKILVNDGIEIPLFLMLAVDVWNFEYLDEDLDYLHEYLREKIHRCSGPENISEDTIQMVVSSSIKIYPLIRNLIDAMGQFYYFDFERIVDDAFKIKFHYKIDDE